MTAAEISTNIKAAFRSLDVHNSGYIHRERLSRIFMALCAWTEVELNMMFNTFDKRGDGFLAYEEFVDWIMGAFEQKKVVDTVATISDPSEVPRMLVGTFNMLGDSFNPFEFLPLDEPVFMEQYAKLRDRSQSLQWADVEPYAAILSQRHTVAAEKLDLLKAHCALSPLWSFFTEEALSKDNKLLTPRINLITFAMKPVDEEDLSKPPIWTLNQYNREDHSSLESIPWFDEMLKCLPAEGGQTKVPYLLQPNLLLWDLTCNVIAVLEQEAHTTICARSYLHPNNYESTGLEFLNKVELAREQGSMIGENLPVVLGFQEWPSEGTAKCSIMTDLFSRNGFSIVLGRFGTALGYRGDLGVPVVLTDRGEGKDEALGPNLKRIDTKRVMKLTIERAQSRAGNSMGLDEQLIYGLVNTTASKTLVVLLCGTIFMVVHAKEPKTEATGELLATYCQNVIEDCRQLIRSSGVIDESLISLSRSWLIVVDTNIAKQPIAKAFREMVCGQVMPGGQPTTSKHRSILHGQCYDTKKCNITVTAPKDHIVAPDGSLRDILIQPDISRGVTLPTSDWGSDHSLLTAVYCVPESQPTIERS